MNRAPSRMRSLVDSWWLISGALLFLRSAKGYHSCRGWLVFKDLSFRAMSLSLGTINTLGG